MTEAFLNAIRDHSARIGIIGLGYVGLPLVRTFAGKGFPVLGFDIDPEKIEKLNRGASYLNTVTDDEVKALVDAGSFEATDHFNRIDDVDAIIICVPTPLTQEREPDLSYVLSTASAISDAIRKDQLVILESTTYPGTTRDELVPILERGGLKAGEDFFVAYSPEREDPGNRSHSVDSIPKLVGGLDEASLELARALYSEVVPEVVPVSSCEVAEAAKLLENIYRSVNIALVNEMKWILDRMGIDVWEVVEAAATKPFGFQAFYPGPGLGGHCIPIDPFYLAWKARGLNVPTRFIELAGELNSRMPEFVLGKLVDALNEQRKPIHGSTILVIGLAYKPNVDDIRESPALEILELLRDRGATLQYHDPFVAEIPPTRKYEFDLKSVDLSPDVLRNADAAILVTDHSDLDYVAIHEHAPMIVDTRNAFASRGISSSKIVKA